MSTGAFRILTSVLRTPLPHKYMIGLPQQAEEARPENEGIVGGKITSLVYNLRPLVGDP